jgi:putative ABC transport system permease protein
MRMDLFRLVMRNIAGSAFRSWVIAIFAALVAGIVITGLLLVRGVEDSLRQMQARLGADLMVVPAGSQSSVENALLMGVPVRLWMPRSVMAAVQGIPGVQAASPQLFLSTMRGASCCSVSDMFMIAYDPQTDFTVRPWLQENLDRPLRLGESIGGDYIFVPEGRENILIYGYEIELAGKLEPTGSGLDQSMFFTFDTAMEIARRSPMQAEAELVIDPDRISAVLVRLDQGADAHRVAMQIQRQVAEVTVIENAQLFRAQREAIRSLLRGGAALSALLGLVSLSLVGMVASMATAERRQEVGVLRALGFSRARVRLTLLAESLALSLAGGIAGTAAAASAVFLFRNFLVRAMDLPLLLPSMPLLLGEVLASLVLGAASVMLATLLPVMRLVSREPGTALKEW